ncbi:zona pellucida sperm-binding protein 3-like [Centroberyx gerrardi]|uniref:zona pellucida sperm-binding protein 3-like n=1 Tax=Centroberyx gerrardi TaxID=166262 RepID=UPI003AAE8FA7
MASGDVSTRLLIIITIECVYGAWSNYNLNSQHVNTGNIQAPARFGPKKPLPLRQEPSVALRLKSQSKQTLEAPLAWRFPVMSEAKPEAKFEQWEPVPAESVTAQCGESGVLVEVRQDLLGNSQPIQSADLTLGGCAATGVDSQLIIYESDLQSCGSQVMMTEDSLIYTFTLIYEPSALGNTPILKTNAAMVDIQCHYTRKHNVSSSDLKPIWTPYTSTKVAEEQFYFTIRLMTDDWHSERPSNQYFLGNIINIEAAIMQYNHMPLRVFVDHCVATLEPDMNAEPRYSFIQNLGCLVDAKLTGSSSRFLPRSEDNKLQIQLEAFRFQQQSSDSTYIICHLRAEPASSFAVSSGNHKACSFINGWRSADGDDQVCRCCETSCSIRKARGLTTVDPVWEGDTMLGPIEIKT